MDIQTLTTFMARLMVLFASMPVHECAHAFAAHCLGDDTADSQGRLNLNPLRHLDVIGSVLIFFTGFGWAKPVPVDSSKFTKRIPRRAGLAITAFAGPLSNILMAFVLMLAFQFILGCEYSQVLFSVAQLLWMMISINVGLAVFNLLPVPPLDGYNVISFFLPQRALEFVRRHMQFFALAIFAVLLFPPLRFIIDVPMSALSGWIFNILDTCTGFMRELAYMWA